MTNSDTAQAGEAASDQADELPEWLPDDYDPDASLPERLRVIGEIDSDIELHAQGDDGEVWNIGKPHQVTLRKALTLRAGGEAHAWDWEVVVPATDDPTVLRAVEFVDGGSDTTPVAEDVDVRLYGVDAHRFDTNGELRNAPPAAAAMDPGTPSVDKLDGGFLVGKSYERPDQDPVAFLLDEGGLRELRREIDQALGTDDAGADLRPQFTFEDGSGLVVTRDGDRLQHHANFDAGFRVLDPDFRDGDALVVSVNLAGADEPSLHATHYDGDLTGETEVDIDLTRVRKTRDATHYRPTDDRYDFTLQLTETEDT